MPQATTFHIPALDCPEELMLIERRLGGVRGIRRIVPDYLSRDLRIEYDAAETDAAAVIEAVKSTGFRTQVKSPAGEPTLSVVQANQAPAVPLTTMVGGLLLICAAILRVANGVTNWPVIVLTVMSTILCGMPVAAAAWRALRNWALDIHVLMTIAAVGAISIGDYFEAGSAMFLFAISLWLERLSIFRAQKAIRSLVQLSPSTAHRLTAHGTAGEQVIDVNPSELIVGETVLVRPGERIPIDGTILSGESAVNQAPITGESFPVHKQTGSRVFAGTLNGEGSLIVTVDCTAGNTTLAHISRLIDEARASRSPTERFIDQFARRYTPAVIAVAVALMIIPPTLAHFGVAWAASVDAIQWVHRGLVLLVIACPCALVISTPVTIVSALHRATRAGILVKGGEFLEKMARVSNIALDKTGTVTTGILQVLAIETFNGYSSDELLGLAAALERHSEHPIAAAISKAAADRGLNLAALTSVAASRGFGVSGTLAGETFFLGNAQFFSDAKTQWSAGDLAQFESEGGNGSNTLQPEDAVAISTNAWLGTRQRLLGVIRLVDRARPEAADAIDQLRKLGVRRIVLLTGDSAATAQAIGHAIGIEEVHANLLPQDKVHQMRLLSESGVAAMAGDGVNDAPAMAAADIGIALGGQSSDTAMETADVVIMSPDLSKLPELIRLGRRCRRLLKQNIGFSLATKLAVIALAAAGLATMWMAVLADVGASLIVIANGMRMIGHNERDRSRTEEKPHARSL